MKTAAIFFAIAATLISSTAFSEPFTPSISAEKDDTGKITLTAKYHGCTKDQHLGTLKHILPFRAVDPKYVVTNEQLENIRQAYEDTLGIARNAFINAVMPSRDHKEMSALNPFSLTENEARLMHEDEKALLSFHEKIKKILDNQSSHGDPEAQHLLDIGFKYTLVLSEKKIERSYSDTPSPLCKQFI